MQGWHPIEDIRSLAENMCGAFDSVPRRAEERRRLPRHWSSDQKLTLAENGEGFVVTVELPQVAKKDLHVNVSETAVTIFAHWSKEARAKAKDGAERVAHADQLFSRVIQLPAAVKAERSRATFRDRVLKIFLPRARPSEVRRIEVK